MSVLRNLEAKLEGLVEGAFSRAFRSQVQPVELARKLAKEMEDAKSVSLSRHRVLNHKSGRTPSDRSDDFYGSRRSLRQTPQSEKGAPQLVLPRCRFRRNSRLPPR